MPVFSIGFVSSATPGSTVISVCGTAVGDWPVTATWVRDDGMNCGCESGCIAPGFICAPQGDDLRVLFSVFDNDGDEYDLTGATEIVMAVADDRNGPVRFVKRLSTGDITLSGSGYQFVVYLTDEDTVIPVRQKNYYEVRVTNSVGENKTVSAGLYRADRTIIKDLP